ncbi:hypothetical protein Tco_1472432 [Tanacetum coccineum]
MASLQFSPLFSSTYTRLPQPQFKLLRCKKPLSVRCSVGNSEGDSFDAKAFRHKFTRSENYKRFNNKESSMTMNEEFKSVMLVDQPFIMLITCDNLTLMDPNVTPPNGA